jgi:HK97 family phage major capsid protein
MAYNRLKDLRQQKADLVNAMDAMLKEAEDGALALDENAYGSRKAELEKVLKLLHVEEAKQEEDRDAARRWSDERDQQRGLTGDPGDSGDALNGARLRLLQREVGKGRSYRDLFGPVVAQQTFHSFDEFAGILYRSQFDPRLIAAGMTEGIPGKGGFLVPTEYVAAMLDKSLESEIVRPRAQVVSMASNTKVVGSFANPDDSTSSPYGFSLQWLDEAGSISLKKGTLRQIRLNAKKGAVLTAVSNELLADGTTFEEQLATAIIGAVGWGMDDAFLNGDGSGKPLGVLKAPSLIVIVKEAGQPAGSILYENLTKMYARMHPGCVGNSVWIANIATIPQLLSLSLPIGTGGMFYPALKETAGTFSLLGRPVLFTEKVPTVGQQGDLTICDQSQYIIGMRKEVTMERSGHYGFATDESYIRTITRVDGQPAWDKVFTPKAGSTLSWAVTLPLR